MTAAMSAAAALLVAAPMVLQWGGMTCWRAFDNRVLHWLGERSYSIYLLHIIPIFFLTSQLRGLADGSPWDMLVALAAIEFALLLPAGALVYRYIERPFLELKSKRRSGSLRPVPAQAG